jgi:hypothetical protein
LSTQVVNAPVRAGVLVWIVAVLTYSTDPCSMAEG